MRTDAEKTNDRVKSNKKLLNKHTRTHIQNCEKHDYEINRDNWQR